jgi:hypothetical protein
VRRSAAKEKEFIVSIEQAVSLVLPLADPSATLEHVGGKGASLSRMAAAGLPVPPGFHITTAAYRHFVAENDLQPRILSAVAGVAHDAPASLDAAATQIAELFAHGAMPDEIAQAIRQAYTQLGGGGELSVAVRSSATAEDLPEMSFAGQQETYLNVRGATQVLVAVKRCWASLWTARAIGYRASCAGGHRARECKPGGRRGGARARRCCGRPLHCQSRDRRAQPDDDQRRLGAGRGYRQRAGHPGYTHRREGQWEDSRPADQREGRDDRARA